MKPLSLAIVGADHPNKRGPTRRFEIALCKPGDPVELRPEPRNKHDEHAIAVFSERGVQLGYVTAERAPWIGTTMNRHDVVAVFQCATRFGCAIRVGFDGEVPALPIDPPDPVEHDGFWPDEVWPEK